MQYLRKGNYYTVDEFAVKAKKNRKTIFRWIKAGKVKPLYIGDIIRFHESDIKKYFVLESVS